MKKHLILGLIGLLGLSMLSFTMLKPKEYEVDTSASSIVWTAKKVTGSHTGKVGIKKGMLEMEGDKITGGYFEIDMNSMSCTDLSGKSAKKLVKHLKSEDFFGVETYPFAKLTIVKAVWQGANNYKITADLTIKQHTKPLKFSTTVFEKKGRITANASLSVDRTEYDVRYGSGSFFENLGDKTIYDDFTLEVNLVAK